MVFAVLPHYTHNGVVNKQTNTTKNVPVFTQVCKLIPPFLLKKTLTEALRDHVRALSHIIIDSRNFRFSIMENFEI